MFHVNDNLFFGRMDAGAVKVMQLLHAPTVWPKADDPPSAFNGNLMFCFIVKAESWAAVMASVSKRGEEHGRYYIAKAFHNDTKPFEVKGLHGG